MTVSELAENWMQRDSAMQSHTRFRNCSPGEVGLREHRKYEPIFKASKQNSEKIKACNIFIFNYNF